VVQLLCGPVYVSVRCALRAAERAMNDMLDGAAVFSVSVCCCCCCDDEASGTARRPTAPHSTAGHGQRAQTQRKGRAHTGREQRRVMCARLIVVRLPVSDTLPL
jgi:hypothetical protein